MKPIMIEMMAPFFIDEPENYPGYVKVERQN